MTGLSAAEIAQAVAARKITALAVIEAALARIDQHDTVLNSFTDVTADRARAKARAIDAALAAGEKRRPARRRSVRGEEPVRRRRAATRRGSKINRDLPPASRDATLIERLEAAGAVLVGALNMGEYAYDFTGENVHDGPSRNPHDPTRMTGGSSGGSGGAVAGALVPLALGSDTNGSIRVPSSFCGIFGLKPTYGRLSRARTFPFVASLDHLGPLARSVTGSRARLRRHAGPRRRDAGLRRARDRAVTPLVGQRLRSRHSGSAHRGRGRLFSRRRRRRGAWRRSSASRRRSAPTRTIELPEAARARAAAYVITATEGAALHLDRLRTAAARFRSRGARPADRRRHDPGRARRRAQKFRRWYRDACSSCSRRSTSSWRRRRPAPRRKLGQTTFVLDGVELPVRANIGIYTQPISFIGLPVVAVPVPLEPMPIGVQIIAAPWREDIALRVAFALEQMGVAAAPQPRGF